MIKKGSRKRTLFLFGTPETIRTSDLCLRRATLYPTELRAQIYSAAYSNRQISRDAGFHRGSHGL